MSQKKQNFSLVLTPKSYSHPPWTAPSTRQTWTRCHRGISSSWTNSSNNSYRIRTVPTRFLPPSSAAASLLGPSWPGILLSTPNNRCQSVRNRFHQSNRLTRLCLNRAILQSREFAGDCIFFSLLFLFSLFLFFWNKEQQSGIIEVYHYSFSSFPPPFGP